MEFIQNWFNHLSSAGKLKLIKEQRRLLKEGMPAYAEVIETDILGDRIGNLQAVQLWLKLQRPDGSFVYTHARTVIHSSAIPGKGQLLNIKYMPQDLSTVVII
jgi:hypothetical protein